MSLKTCKECGNSVSSKAEKCPQCGNPIKKKASCLSVGCLIIVLSIVLGVIISSFSSTSSSTPQNTNPRKTQIGKHFSAWDGSHNGLTKYIKKSMNDPKSYEHVETRYSDNGDHLMVKTTFRGKNAFGGLVTNSITAKVDLNGNVLNVISQDP